MKSNFAKGGYVYGSPSKGYLNSSDISGEQIIPNTHWYRHILKQIDKLKTKKKP